MLSIGRSLGIAMIAATQTVEGITEKLGETAAAKWLAVYGSAISSCGRSPASDRFIAERAGSTWKAEIGSVPGVSVRDSMTSSVLGGCCGGNQEASLDERVCFSCAVPASAPFIQRSDQAAQNRIRISADPRQHREPDEGVSSTVGTVPLVHPEELSTLLAEPNLALAVAVRGRVPRRDVIKLSPKFD